MNRLTKRLVTSVTVVTAVTILTAACSSGGGSATTSTAASGASAAGLAKAQAMVKQLESTTSTYPVPTASISGVAKFSGRTVYYIPLVQQIPGFVVTAAAMKVALAKVGVKVQVCDGQGQPSAVASCVGQAVAANAAGIVTDAIPYGMAQNALDAAKKKNIPIVIADQYPPTGTTNSDAVTYVPGVVDQPSDIAWWTIADSKGRANAILASESDSPSSAQYVTNSLPIYKQYCPGCTIQVKGITASTDTLLASATSSNLLKNPDTTYYYTEFEDSLQPTIQGIQQSGRTGISLSVAGGSINGLGLVKSNSVVKAVVAVDQAFAGWALSDEVLRMMTGSAPVTETFPVRLFTKDNIGTVQVTAADQASGAWFGDTSFQADFAKLWGAA